MMMDFKDYIRKPFVVEAVEITRDNIEECAEIIGELCFKDDGSPYIQVDQELVPNVFRVFPGYWMTKMGDNVRCYSKKVFKDQFIEQDQSTKRNHTNDKKTEKSSTVS
jgi:hypothetical protein